MDKREEFLEVINIIKTNAYKIFQEQYENKYELITAIKKFRKEKDIALLSTAKKIQEFKKYRKSIRIYDGPRFEGLTKELLFFDKEKIK